MLYIAGNSAKADHAKQLSYNLGQEGHNVIHSWTAFNAATDGLTEPERWKRCLSDINKCDAIIILYDEKIAGAIFEAGYAYAQGKPVYILISLAQITEMRTWTQIRGCQIATGFFQLRDQLRWLL